MVLKLLETLINEHGSATILKERLGLVAQEYGALERANAVLQSQCQQQTSELEQLRARVGDLQRELEALQSSHGARVCDHCGSSRIKRTGSRADPVFGELGGKLAVYRCDGCGGETTVTLDP